MFPSAWSCKNSVAIEEHQASSPFVRKSFTENSDQSLLQWWAHHYLSQSSCIVSASAQLVHVMRDQIRILIFYAITSCCLMIRGHNTFTSSFLNSADCPMCGSPSNDSWLSLNLCYLDTMYWNIIHWTGYHSDITITHFTNCCQNLMLADSLRWSISPPWNVSCTGLFFETHHAS
jgi:hypothetical protein